jgi:multiple sugar transport system permease protein
MATVAEISKRERASDNIVVDYSSANMFGLTCAALVLFAFIFMPWAGTKLQDNGARIMSDALVGPYPEFFNYESLWILLVPISALTALVLCLWGISSVERGRVVTQLTALCGLVGLFYFVTAYLNTSPSPVRDNGAGFGFWVVLFGMIGLASQSLITRPAIYSRWQNNQKTLGSVLPKFPPKAVPYFFLAVPLILYLIWIIVPTLITFYLSLTNWDGVSPPEFVGFYNYERMFGLGQFADNGPSPYLTTSIINNIRWVVVFLTVPTTAGLGLAMLFNSEMRGGRWYKVSFYSPLVLSFPVIGLVWSWIYNPRLGLINSTLRGIGVVDPPGWLADTELAIWAIIAAAVWRQVGYVMILYLAGLKNIDPSMIDAALVDGANRWQLFRRVIFPLLAPVTTIIFVISVIDSFRSFDLVRVMTLGNTGTQVLAHWMYTEAFNNYEMGYGAAIAVVLFTISLVVIGFYLHRAVRDELEY